MGEAAKESKPRPRWYQYGAVALVAALLVAADKKQDSEALPDLNRHVWLRHFSDEKAKVIAYLKKLSDDELKKVLNDILKLTDFRSRSGYEPCLSEMIRRGGKQWELFLKEKLDALMKSKVKPYEKADELVPGSSFNLELLTALRRVTKQPDPLQIFIDERKELTGMASALPYLKVKIKNVDVQKVGIGFTVGGNYRSGRQSRWRIFVQDEKGKVIPVRKRLGCMGGGLYTEGILEHGKSWETSLNVRNFIEVPSPGKYKLTVLYHNTQTIAGESNVEGLIVSRSKPVPFTVKPITIAHSKEDREAVSKLVSELDAKKKLKVIAGTYGEWAHELISPDSPEGKLLSMGLKAVPTIIESLHDRTFTKEKRAWLFGILFSLTSENDPRQTSVLGSYEYWESGWQIWGGLTGEAPSGGLSTGSKGSISGGEIKSKAQDKLIKIWDNWLKKVEVKEVNKD